MASAMVGLPMSSYHRSTGTVPAFNPLERYAVGVRAERIFASKEYTSLRLTLRSSFITRSGDFRYHWRRRR
jgi:hypothetical protein